MPPGPILVRFRRFGPIPCILVWLAHQRTNRPETFPERSTNRGPYSIIHVPGPNYDFHWNSEDWTISPGHPSLSIIDPPQPFFLPPSAPGNPDFRTERNDDPRRPFNYFLPADPDEDFENQADEEDENENENDSEADTEEFNAAIDARLANPQNETTTCWVLPPPTWNEQPSITHCVRCWCRTDLCNCGYRPDTSPTPPNITLWTPGDKHLPSRD